MLDLWAEGCCSTGPDLADIVGNMDTQIGNSLHSKMEEFQTAGSPDESAASLAKAGWLDNRTAGWTVGQLDGQKPFLPCPITLTTGSFH